MTVETIMAELKAKGNESIKKTLLKHGIKEPLFGVKVADLKVIQKRVKKDYELSKGLYATGNTDAMYLAGLIADEKQMTKPDLEAWVKQASSFNIIEYTVPWIAAESRYGYELALQWIEAKQSSIAASGWAALASLVAIKPDEELNIPALKKLMARVQKDINTAEERVRHNMNSFVIAAGCYVAPLTEYAISIAPKITTDKDGRPYQMPNPAGYIKKVKDRGSVGKKKKMARC